ncbi:MAG: phosphoribosyltransferase family protein [Candidatus Woesebacteria bacterium]
MSVVSDKKFLHEAFLKDVRVIEKTKGYLSVPSFNLRVDPRILSAGAKLIAHEFQNDKVEIVHAIPNSAHFIATAVALELGEPVRLHNSRKDSQIPVTWKEVYRKEVRSFTQSTDGSDFMSGLTFSFVRKGDRVLLIDDICARGETGARVIEGLLEKGVKVVGFAVLFDKVFQGGLARIEKLGVKTFSCVRVKSIHTGDSVELE